MESNFKEAILVILLFITIALCFTFIGYMAGMVGVRAREGNAYYKGLNTHFTYRVDTVWSPIKK